MPVPAFAKGRSAILAGVILLAVIAAASGAGIWAVRRGALAALSGPADLAAARERLAAEGLAMPLADPTIVVHKAERRLDLLDGTAVVRSYRVALGGELVGHKLREGDGRTPEGRYRVCTRLERSRFHLFLGLDYPAPEDALGRADITAAESGAIKEAHRSGGVPPWNTALGGAIGIHGGGAGRDWTLGCIALEDCGIEEVFLLTERGTPVLVLP
ncbi:MAG: L,D-transpeptidase family protein [Candidatus Sumerlaeia bacterium]|nr:L,D-transpeptidase family protein [Candidatus Sumerlaeia bacterium]